MVDPMEPGLRLVRAGNRSPMTGTGTNTWLLGEGPVAVIDPGPDDPRHLEAIIAAAPRGISHILVTHPHLDHSALVPRLARISGAPVLGFGSWDRGRSARMQALVDMGLAKGGEGVDRSFAPDICLADGEIVEGAGFRLEALHTPGHFAGHLAFREGGRLFSGDLVMGWAPSIISPPDGELAAYLSSLARLRALPLARLFPGHGDPVDDPAARLDWLRDHRAARTLSLREALETRPQSIPELTRRIYRDTPAVLLPAAERNVFAHLIDLVDKGQATATPSPGAGAAYARPPPER